MVYPLDLGEQWTEWTLLSFRCTIAEASFGDSSSATVFLVRFACTEFLEFLVSP